jgi:hypothetical protein
MLVSSTTILVRQFDEELISQLALTLLAGFPEMTVSPIDAFPGFPTNLNPNLGEDIVYFDIGKNYFGKVDVVSIPSRKYALILLVLTTEQSFSGSEPQVTLSVYADDEAPVSFTYKLSELTPK